MKAFPQALLFCFAKTPSQVQRDFKWLGSYRYGILHLASTDALQLQADCQRASQMLGWPAPYVQDLRHPVATSEPVLERDPRQAPFFVSSSGELQ